MALRVRAVSTKTRDCDRTGLLHVVGVRGALEPGRIRIFGAEAVFRRKRLGSFFFNYYNGVCRCRAWSTKTQTPRSDSANLESSEPIKSAPKFWSPASNAAVVLLICMQPHAGGVSTSWQDTPSSPPHTSPPYSRLRMLWCSRPERNSEREGQQTGVLM